MNIDSITQKILIARYNEMKWLLGDTAGELFRSAIAPTYGAKDNGKPLHIGTATLIEVSGVKLLLTAAHVVDENEYSTLYVGDGEKLVEIHAEFGITKAANRDLDHYDFAFARIPEAMLPALADRCIPEANHRPGLSTDKMRLYSALGFPNSKNKNYDNARKIAKASDYSYSSVHRPKAFLSKKLPGSGGHHLQIQFEKRSTDERGATVDTFGPRGLSGGPVIDAGSPLNPHVMFGRIVPIPRIVGITIELKAQRLIAVRLDAILPSIRKFLADAQ